MRSPVVVAAPAKINLGLRVVGRRGDGYHELQSVLLPLDAHGPLADRVEVAVRAEQGVALVLSGECQGVPAGERNLAHRAARAFLARAGLREGVSISLEKRVPAGSGLGGGSADAGAVLRALAALHAGAVGAEALFEIALGLGADVPFFLDPRPAEVAGIGEKIVPLQAAPSLPVVVAWPGISLSTAAVYRSFDASGRALTKPAPTPTLGPLVALAEDPEALAARVRNDLEAEAAALAPGIARLLAELRAAGALGAAMSGSGSAVYGVFASEERRDRAFSRLDLLPPARAWATATEASPAPHERGRGVVSGGCAGASPNW